MVIDFSKGIDYWLGAINKLFSIVDDFLFSCFGIHLFAPSEAAEEETTEVPEAL